MLEFLFSFLLSYTPPLSVLIFSVIILVIVNIFYKILINQNDAKQLKQRTKDISKEMKIAQKAGDKDKSKKLMSQLLQENNKMMRMTLKPMIVSLIVVVILLPSLATFYGDKIVQPGGNVTLSGTPYQIQKDGSMVTVGSVSCSTPCTTRIGQHSYKITQQDNGIKIAQIVAVLPITIPFFGNSFGWLGWYILCSVPLVIVIRKAMKIYM